MSKYLKQGSHWKVSSDADADFREVLPAGNYIVKHSQFGFFLEESPSFTVGRVYGDSSMIADRVMSTYLDRGRNTGVLAVGDKGTGKTLLTRLISRRAASKHSMPTILVNDGFCGDEFNTFLTGIDQRAVVLFDEFEKTYKKDQEPLLTLLDGVHQSNNKLFLLTANDEYAVDKCMMSRPGRIYYYLEFGPLTREFVGEYCQENLLDRSQIDMVADVSEVYGNFSFDTLKGLVEEMNRYGESPHSALKFLNIRMDRWKSHDRYFNLSVSQDGVAIDDDRVDERNWSIDPGLSSFTIEITTREADKDDEDDQGDHVTLKICPDRVVSIRDGGKVIVYRDNGYDIEARMREAKKFDHLESLASGYSRPYSLNGHRD